MLNSFLALVLECYAVKSALLAAAVSSLGCCRANRPCYPRHRLHSQCTLAECPSMSLPGMYLPLTFVPPTSAGVKRVCGMQVTAAHLGGQAAEEQGTPFTLIQGPPGTGKTHTVTGVLNVWHHVAYQRYFQPLVGTLKGEALSQEREGWNPEEAAMVGFDEAFERR